MAEPIEHHISPVDAFTLTLERDPLLRATIVAVAAFDRPPDWDTLRHRIDRASRLAPRFREKLITVPFGLAPQRWVVDENFDLSLHLHRMRVPDGGGARDVLDVARAAGLTAFDHDRPLWEFTLVEGLPDGRAALVMKLHHALTDGVGGIEIAAHVVDLEREPATRASMPPAPAPRDHGLLEVVGDTVDHHRRRLTNAGEDLLRSAPGMLRDWATDPIGTATSTVDTVRAVARFVRPVTRTASPVMSGRRPLRHYDQLDVDLAGLAEAAHAVGGTLNDAFLAGIAGGMRRYHEHHFALVDHLVVSMPISVRREGDDIGGNRVTVERFDLPVAEADPARRMVEIGRICRELRHDPAIPWSEAVSSVLNLLPVDVTAGMLKHVDLLASNVAGFGDEVFIGGALLESFHVFGATLGSAANITLMSYRDTCHLGINTDSGAVLDPDTFLDCLREGFAEVTG